MIAIEELAARARADGLPVDTWGAYGTATKPLESLHKEIIEGSAAVPPWGPLSCSRHSVCTEVSHLPLYGGEELVLVEAEQVFPGGALLERRLACVRETLQGKESFAATACRGLFEELGILVDPREIVNGNAGKLFGLFSARKPVIKRYISKVYPGLPTIRTEWHNVFYMMPHRHYVKDGYVLFEDNITTTFRWVPRSQVGAFIETPPAGT